MKLFTRNGPTLVAAALLAGCGGSQPPIGAPGAQRLPRFDILTRGDRITDF